MKKYQRAYTLVDLQIAIFFLVVVVGGGGVVYVAWHFISKFW